MKPIYLTVTFMISFILGAAVFADPDFSRPMPEEVVQSQPKSHANKQFKQMPKRPSPEEFDRRLNLTDEQKAFAKAQREKSIEKIKPILNEIKVKKAKIETLSAQNAPVEEITALDNEVKELRKQAHEIRKANMKAFEATLTESQKKELQKMKNEGRKEFEKYHKQFHNINMK